MLTSKMRDKIIDDQLAFYRRRLQDHHATPMTCLGVGHDHCCGTLVVCMREDLPLENMRNFLVAALEQVQDAIDRGEG